MMKKTDTVFIIILLIITSIVFFIRCYNQESIGDEVLYEYVWEQDDNTNLWDENHRLDRKIRSFDEIVTSQIQHYKYANGRSLVHAGEQAFTDHKIAFSIVNTIIFLLLVFFIIRYCFPGNSYHFSKWLFVVLILLYCFPNNQIWISINLAPNYLWPAMLSLLVLLCWDYSSKNKAPGFLIPFFIILGLVFGWTHEGYVIGVGGGMFLYYCLNLKDFKGSILWLAIPLWISAIFMIFSPGNINRFFNNGGGNETGLNLVGKLSNSLLVLSEAWVLCIFLITFVLLLLWNKKSKKEFIGNNSRIVYVFLISFLFGLMANTNPHSFTYIILFGFLIISRIINKWGILDNKYSDIVAIFLLIPFTFQQTLIAKDNIANYRFQHRIIEDYKKSHTGIMEYAEPRFSSVSAPWVKRWNLNEIRQSFPYKNWNKAYHKDTLPPLFLIPEEYLVFSSPDAFFIEKNKIKGEAKVYKSPNGTWAWVKPDEKIEGKQLYAKLKPADLSYEVPLPIRLKWLLLSRGNFFQDITLEIDTISIGKYKFYKVLTPPILRIDSLYYRADF